MACPDTLARIGRTVDTVLVGLARAVLRLLAQFALLDCNMGRKRRGLDGTDVSERILRPRAL